MAAPSLQDLVVVLPGITGSVLQVRGEDVWAPSLRAIGPAVTSLGASLEALALTTADDPDRPDLEDGVRATALMPRVVVPGLIKIDGYSRIMDMIADTFGAIRGELDGDEPANLFAFPYDWRRDNRVAANRLKAFVDKRLPIWREYFPAAKVIVIGHSMGGLIARYYLEVLEGWRDCKALITIGTPFRGSLDALGYLANGYKQMFLDLTTMLRSCTSVYQLLPIYPVVRGAGAYTRVAETTGLPSLVDAAKAQHALTFHREIEAAVTRHMQDAEYLQSFKTVPFVGTLQPTMQSAVLAGGSLTVRRDVPDIVDALLAGGDGTVPRVSGVPIELSDDYRETFYPERHSALPANVALLNDLARRLEQMQAKGTGNVRGPEKNTARSGDPAIGVDLDDAYRNGEPVVIRAVVHNASGDASLHAALERLDVADGSPVTSPLTADGDGWTATFEGLAPGRYRVSVDGRCAAGRVDPVHDLFDVLAPAASA